VGLGGRGCGNETQQTLPDSRSAAKAEPAGMCAGQPAWTAPTDGDERHKGLAGRLLTPSRLEQQFHTGPLPSSATAPAPTSSFPPAADLSVGYSPAHTQAQGQALNDGQRGVSPAPASTGSRKGSGGKGSKSRGAVRRGSSMEGSIERGSAGGKGGGGFKLLDAEDDGERGMEPHMGSSMWTDQQADFLIGYVFCVYVC